MIKIKNLFERILDTVNKENPHYPFDFEQLVNSFDENDHFTERVFGFFIREKAQRYRTANPTAHHSTRPRPHTIHHYLGVDGVVDDSTSGDAANNDDSGNAGTSSTQGPNRRLPQRLPYLSHSILPILERDVNARASSSSGSPAHDTPPPSSSSGAALRYLLSSQGFGHSGTRRSRLLHRSSSSDMFSSHPSLQSTMTSLSASTPSTETSTAQNGGSGQEATGNGSGSSNAGDLGASSSHASASASLRRSLRRGDTLERQRTIIYRPSSRVLDLSSSMESAPESFRFGSWDPPPSGTSLTSESFDSAPGDLFGSNPSDRILDQARHLQEYIRQAQELQHQQRRQLYIQSLQRGRRRLSWLAQQEATQQSSASSPSSTDPPQPQEPRYQSSNNGLMLVQPFPSSNSPFSNNSPRRTPPHSSVTALEDRYREFIDSTRRSRSAMRSARMADALSEETQQVLLAGEISRRRRRRIQGRFGSLTGSPDMALQNSSTIISESQQEQQTAQGQAQDREDGPSSAQNQPPSELSAATSEGHAQDDSASTSQPTTDLPQGAAGSLNVTDTNASLTLPAPSSEENHGTTPPEPRFADELSSSLAIAAMAMENARSRVSEGVGLGLNADDSASIQDNDEQQHQSVPQTPPSPNPNRNPMPTFTDRRRSSINPADIEAVVREMEAGAHSRLHPRTIPSAMDTARHSFPFHALTPVSVPEEASLLDSQNDASVPRSSGQGLVTGTHPLPSPPQTELEADSVPGGVPSPVETPSLG